MGLYLTLFKHTTDGKENIENAEAWLETGMEMAAEVGAEVRDVYFGDIGEYDALTITEGSREAAEKVRVAFEEQGTHKLEIYPIFEAHEYLELIEERPA